MPLVRGSSMMSLGTWSKRSTRYQRFLNLCNVFLLITSTILIFSAVVLMSFYHLTKLEFWSKYFYWTPLIMLGLGLYTFLVSVYGFLISNRESRGLISMIAVFLSIAFLGQIFSIYTAFELRYKINAEVIPEGDALRNMRTYLTDESVKYNWDWMQRDLRCCGSVNYESGFQSWDTILSGSVPDSCCRKESEFCGKDKISSFTSQRAFIDLGIWKDGCLDILQLKISNEVVPMLLVYAGVGALLAIVELITVVLACAYVAQIGRRIRRDEHMWKRTGNAAAGGNEEEYLPSLNAKETNF